MSILGAEFDAAVNRLKNAAADFMNVYSQFVSIPTQYRMPEWQDVKNQADYVQAVISNTTAGIDSAYQWAASAVGLSGLAAVGMAIPMALPITVGAIGLAVSAIMTTYGYMTEQLNKSAIVARVAGENIARAEQGLPPIDPNMVIQQETGIFGNMADLVKWLAIGGFAVFVAPKLIDKFKER